MIEDKVSKFVWAIMMLTSWSSFVISLWMGTLIHPSFVVSTVAWLLIFLIGIAVKMGKKE